MEKWTTSLFTIFRQENKGIFTIIRDVDKRFFPVDKNV